MDKLIAQTMAEKFSGPIVFQYVWWVLSQAQKRGLHRLYFLARDGYLLREIAQRFCKKFDLSIECRYLYCSRASLRMPLYHLIGEEAYKLLFLGGYQVTLSSLLQRAELNECERKAVCVDCGLSFEHENILLNKKQLHETCAMLRESKVFREYITEKSKAAYPKVLGYLQQEGVLDESKFAIVDSGWTGSMQRSLRQILESAGFQGKMIGFYFGMFAAPKSAEDGEYFPWYFDHCSHILRKILFCNNLFECLLSAPHGMTIGFSQENNRYMPVCLPSPAGKHLIQIQTQIEGILSYTDARLQRICFVDYHDKGAKRQVFQKVWRYMAHPTGDEAAYYGGFTFCDDITEAYQMPLASLEQANVLKGYSMIRRVGRKIFSCKQKEVLPELFWPYGTIAFLPIWKRVWYRWNVYVWEWIRYMLR